jgi:hypothetical protein
MSLPTSKDDAGVDASEASGMLDQHALAHLATIALLKQQNRYDRLTSDVEKITGTPPLSVYDFVLRHANAYAAGN